MAYVRDITEVKGVLETTDLLEVNDKIANGWMVLQVVSAKHNKTKFLLGRF